MQRIHTAWRRLLVGGVLAFVALCTWASWETPALHHYALAVQVLLVHVEGVRIPAQAMRLQQQLEEVPGVSACTINPRTGLATVLYDEDTVPEAEVRRVLSVGGLFRVETAKLAAPAAPERQCPVPPGYVQAIERLRFTFNIRRLWVPL